MAQSARIGISGGISLHYLEAGSGAPLVMIPGWSQSAAEFGRNIEALAAHRRVIALDMRGHGESDKPPGGYRIQRLAKDLSEALVALKLDHVDLLGHSMGSSIIWSYLDLFGPDRLGKLVLVDEAPMVAPLPGWSEAEKADYGCFLPDVQSVAGFADAVRAAGSVEGTLGIIRGMFTSGVPEADLRWIAAENLKLPRAHAADLVFDHCLNDWRETIRSIRLPSLVVGGEASIFPARSQQWIAEQNPNARASIYSAHDKGSHFMFYENPARFNAEVISFLDG
jgi:non-heme chloroperoxidase